MSMSIKVARSQHMGDPGLLGFLGKVGKGILGGASGLLTGGVTGAVTGAVSPFLGTRAKQQLGIMPTNGRQVPQAQQGGFRIPAPGPGQIRIRPGAALPGGRPFISREGGEVVPQGMKLACPGGYHPNKSSYFLSDGTFIPEGSKCVKNRRRNPMNPRALDRAIGRLEGAKRLQSKLRGFSTPKYTAAGTKKDC